MVVGSPPLISHNGWQLPEGDDFEAVNYLPPLNLVCNTRPHLTTEPQLS